MTEFFHGLEHQLPKVYLLNATPLGVGELAGRTAYDSFQNSENEVIRHYNPEIGGDLDVDSSQLMDDLLNVYFHGSVAEHLTFNFLIQGTDRGVLQELVRHRMAAYTVRSTRYTGNDILYAFIAASITYNTEWFIKKVKSFDMFSIIDEDILQLEIAGIYLKLSAHTDRIGAQGFFKKCLAKDNLEYVTALKQAETLEDGDASSETVFNMLSKNKSKRNSLDPFKHIVTDMWKVDLVWTVNLRSLDNFLKLRDSGAAWYRIKYLAEAVREALPEKYAKLINKKGSK